MQTENHIKSNYVRNSNEWFCILNFMRFSFHSPTIHRMWRVPVKYKFAISNSTKSFHVDQVFVRKTGRDNHNFGEVLTNLIYALRNSLLPSNQVIPRVWFDMRSSKLITFFIGFCLNQDSVRNFGLHRPHHTFQHIPFCFAVGWHN